MADNLILSRPHHRRRVSTIDDLPDDVLIEIFDIYVFRYQYLGFRQFSAYETKRKIESWQTLVHVCRQWRGVVFGSPRRLNLQLVYVPRRSAGVPPDVWPAFPLHVFGSVTGGEVLDGVIPGLEHRISQINLVSSTSPQTEKLWTAMQVPFPELEGLFLYSKTPPFYSSRFPLPDLFLGGSAPRLRHLYLDGIPFPALPKLLVSATHLVKLSVYRIYGAMYILPEAMAGCLAMATSLESLQLEFEPNIQYPSLKGQTPPEPRSILPILATFRFKGLNKYLEVFLERIDAPRLSRLSMTFSFHFGFDTDAAKLDHFISRTPTLGAYDEAHLIFDSSKTLVRLRQSHPEPSDHGMVEVDFPIQDPVQRFSFIVPACTSSLRPLLTMENLYIDGDFNSASDDITNANWLDLLRPFTSVKDLYLSQTFSQRIALVLQDLAAGGRTREVLPALQSILLEGFQPSKRVKKGIVKFISARRLANRPVVMSAWLREEWDISALEVDGL